MSSPSDYDSDSSVLTDFALGTADELHEQFPEMSLEDMEPTIAFTELMRDKEALLEALETPHPLSLALLLYKLMRSQLEGQSGEFLFPKKFYIEARALYYEMRRLQPGHNGGAEDDVLDDMEAEVREVGKELMCRLSAGIGKELAARTDDNSRIMQRCMRSLREHFGCPVMHKLPAELVSARYLKDVIAVADIYLEYGLGIERPEDLETMRDLKTNVEMASAWAKSRGVKDPMMYHMREFGTSGCCGCVYDLFDRRRSPPLNTHPYPLLRQCTSEMMMHFDDCVD